MRKDVAIVKGWWAYTLHYPHPVDIGKEIGGFQPEEFHQLPKDHLPAVVLFQLSSAGRAGSP